MLRAQQSNDDSMGQGRVESYLLLTLVVWLLSAVILGYWYYLYFEGRGVTRSECGFCFAAAG